jgi:hypothetical protein
LEHHIDLHAQDLVLAYRIQRPKLWLEIVGSLLLATALAGLILNQRSRQQLKAWG